MSSKSYIIKYLYFLMPPLIQNWLYTYAGNKKMERWKTNVKVKVDKEQVDDIFKTMNIDKDVMVHSSLPDIGNINRDAVFDNLQKYIIDRGHTILCPAIPIKGSTLEYLKSISEFDVRTAPNAMGVISKYYEKQENAKRSLSPTHSVVAYGDQATYYTKDHHHDETPFAENSPYFKLLLKGGKILIFGGGFRLTFAHVIDDMIGEKDFPVQVYDSRRFCIEVIDEKGEGQKCVFRAHSYKTGLLMDMAAMSNKIMHLSSTQVYHLGCSDVILLDARAVALCMLQELKLGFTIYHGRRRVSEDCRKKADNWIEYIKQL